MTQQIEHARSLTQEHRELVWNAINSNRDEDDRDPREVIDQDYGGDIDTYLRKMAAWHDVNLAEK